jgi:hypothetical protein
MTNPKMKYTKPTLTALNVAETNAAKPGSNAENNGNGGNSQKFVNTPAS